MLAHLFKRNFCFESNISFIYLVCVTFSYILLHPVSHNHSSLKSLLFFIPCQSIWPFLSMTWATLQKEDYNICWTWCYMMSQRCFIEFRPGKGADRASTSSWTDTLHPWAPRTISFWQQNVHHSTSRPSYICHMCSAWTCPRPERPRQRPHLWTLGPHATVMDSVRNKLHEGDSSG